MKPPPRSTQRGAAAVLLKGGHLDGEPADALATPAGVEIFSEPRIAGSMHGTGCTLAMALACELAARDARSRMPFVPRAPTFARSSQGIERVIE